MQPFSSQYNDPRQYIQRIVTPPAFFPMNYPNPTWYEGVQNSGADFFSSSSLTQPNIHQMYKNAGETQQRPHQSNFRDKDNNVFRNLKKYIRKNKYSNKVEFNKNERKRGGEKNNNQVNQQNANFQILSKTTR